jgi:glycosyltransferase involved in cell wall biosynthesis
VRILYVINGFDPGGAEHGLLTLLQDGFFDGHELKILAFCKGRGPLAARIASVVGDSNMVLATNNESLTPQACLAGGRLLWRQHREWEPEIVVLSLKQANVIGRAIACLFPASRCVSFEHISRYRAHRAEWAYQHLLWLLSFRVDEIWADCEETHAKTGRYFLPRRRRHHVVPLFRTEPEAPHKTDYTVHTPLRVAAAGRLVERKNFPLAVETMRVLNDIGIAARLDIFGDGPAMGTLQDSVARWNVGDRVRLAGYAADWSREVLDHDLFINLSDTEGFCIVVAEAMAAGLPVIATPVGGIREYGRDGENILFLQTADSGRLAHAIERLAGDELLRRRLGKRARQDMIERFSASAIRTRGQSILHSPEAPRPHPAAAPSGVSRVPGNCDPTQRSY